MTAADIPTEPLTGWREHAPQEMVDMLGAARAYQANLAAIGLIREMVSKALDLGK